MLPTKDFPARPGRKLDKGPVTAVSADALLGFSKTIDKGSRAAKKASKAQVQEQKVARLLKMALKAMSRQDFAAAVSKIEEALKLDKDVVLGWRMLAFASEQRADFNTAFDAYEAVARLEPHDVTLLSSVGRLALRLGKLELANKLLSGFLVSEPDDEEVCISLASVLREQNRYGDAVDHLRSAIGRHPERHRLWDSLGTIVCESGDPLGAAVFYDEALRLNPSFDQARFNRAYFSTVLEDPKQAIEEMKLAIKGFERKEDQSSALLSLALTQLMIGDLVEGFEHYESRFGGTELKIVFAEHGKRWEVGDDLNGKTLLVYGEQGLGDEILFASLINDTLEALGPDGKLYLVVEPRLVDLFQRSFPSAVVQTYSSLREFNTLYKQANLGDQAGSIDLWTPMGSLFRRFRTDLASFPQHDGFLVPDPERVAHWREVLKEAGPGPYVGILWKSLKMEGARQRYYSPFELWSPILEKTNMRFVNLQYGDAAADLAAAKERGFDIWTPPGIDLMKDIDDLAALCAALDVVIGPSTATSNVAGSVGARTCIIANPGWWTGFGGENAPCYPATRVFRAAGFDQWEEVMREIAKALDEDILRDQLRGQVEA